MARWLQATTSMRDAPPLPQAARWRAFLPRGCGSVRRSRAEQAQCQRQGAPSDISSGRCLAGHEEAEGSDHTALERLSVEAQGGAPALHITGRNPQEAIERAVKEYDIAERERFRIRVQREA